MYNTDALHQPLKIGMRVLTAQRTGHSKFQHWYIIGITDLTYKLREIGSEKISWAFKEHVLRHPQEGWQPTDCYDSGIIRMFLLQNFTGPPLELARLLAEILPWASEISRKRMQSSPNPSKEELLDAFNEKLREVNSKYENDMKHLGTLLKEIKKHD